VVASRRGHDLRSLRVPRRARPSTVRIRLVTRGHHGRTRTVTITRRIARCR
jgi:hypothetical protein